MLHIINLLYMLHGKPAHQVFRTYCGCGDGRITGITPLKAHIINVQVQRKKYIM